MAENNTLIKKFSNLFGPTSRPSHPITSVITNAINRSDVREEIDGSAALDSFKTHWSQAFDCMNKKVLNEITVDDITSIVNHIDQMVTLLVQENNYMNERQALSSAKQSPIMMSPLLDYLLIESVLDKLYNWSELSGEWTHIMKLEQLKLYELLVSQVCHNDALFQRPLIRPLLNLLSQFVDKVCQIEVEKRLVVLLNTLCVCLSQNLDLLELFFRTDPILSSHIETKFLIFCLLIPYVHRDGPIGQQARDALLLCMALSRNNDSIGKYVAEESNFCPVLATGLSGLYSSLPRKLLNSSILCDDWHQITAEDIQGSPELELFLNSLEFCNAVAQIAHPLIQTQLLNFVYNGFLLPVIGPALHQDVVGVPLKVLERLSKYRNTLEEIIATTAYFDLFIRTITEPNLLQVFLKFICIEKYEEQRILDSLILRLNAHSKLSLVTLVLFRTLMELNCEDLLLELVLKYLTKGNHLIGGKEHQKLRINDLNSYNNWAQKLLSLMPSSCYSSSHVNYIHSNANADGFVLVDNSDSISQSSNGSDSNYTQEVQYLLFNYLDYLKDAHLIVSNCIRATRSWSCAYDASHRCLDNNGMQSLSNDSSTSICANNHFVPNGIQSQQLAEDEEECSSPIGPFLNTLLSRLEALCENDVYTNLQLTGLISRLASYPQPLLRSFLLNQELVFQSGVKSLSTILFDLHKKLNSFAEQINHFDELIRKARYFLYTREGVLLPKKHLKSSKSDNEFSYKQTRSNSITSLRSETGEVVRRKGLKGFADLFRSTPKAMRRGRSSTMISPSNAPLLESVSGGQGYRYIKGLNSNPAEQALDANEIEENERIQKIVLAAIVFEEFLRELSAICYEHFILEYLDLSSFQSNFEPMPK